MAILDDLLKRLTEIIEQLKRGITEGISGALDGVISRYNSVVGALNDAVSSLGDSVESISSQIGNALDDAITEVSTRLSSVFASILSQFDETFDNISSSLTSFGNSIYNAIKSVIEDISEKITDVYAFVTAAISSAVNSARENVTNVLEVVSDAINKTIENTRSAVASFAASASETIEHLIERLTEIYEKIQKSLKSFYETDVRNALSKVTNVFRDNVSIIDDYARDLGAIITATMAGDAQTISEKTTALLSKRNENDLIQLAVAAAVAVAVLPASVGAIAAPALEVISQTAMARIQPTLLSPNDLARAEMRGLINHESAVVEASKQGLSKQRYDLLYNASRPIVSPGDAQAAFLRGLITKEQHDAILRAHGYTDNDINLISALYAVIPSINDLITMSVREAFSPDVVRKFGQNEDFPEEFAVWCQRQGLSKEWAQRYWAAHWSLPSATQGFEMLQRGIISEDELKLLLRALDVMPFWRERLIKLSYAPYTRVDIRRMYESGILSYEEMVRAYRDIGYDNEKAQKLAEFTSRYYTEESLSEIENFRSMSRGVYEKAYARGIITVDELRNALRELNYRDQDIELIIALQDASRLVESTDDILPEAKTSLRKVVIDGYGRGLLREEETRSMLADIGYSENDIEWFIAVTQYTVNYELKRIFIDALQTNYVQRTLTKEDVIDRLNAINLTSSEINNLLERWDIEREARTRKPTEAQFRAMLLRKLITLEEYEEELRGLGFAEKYVKLLSQLAVGASKE